MFLKDIIYRNVTKSITQVIKLKKSTNKNKEKDDLTIFKQLHNLNTVEHTIEHTLISFVYLLIYDLL